MAEAVPWSVSKTDSCPASEPWAVIKDSTGKVVSCHDSEDSAQAHMRALYANEPDSRNAGQSQAFYACTADDGRWAVVLLPWGLAPERDYGGLTYLGEPIELLRKLYRYRLSRAPSTATVDYVAGMLADELHVSRVELEALVGAGEHMILPSAGWLGLAQACLLSDGMV